MPLEKLKIIKKQMIAKEKADEEYLKSLSHPHGMRVYTKQEGGGNS
jgi:hypothetical protein